MEALGGMKGKILQVVQFMLASEEFMDIVKGVVHGHNNGGKHVENIALPAGGDRVPVSAQRLPEFIDSSPAHSHHIRKKANLNSNPGPHPQDERSLFIEAAKPQTADLFH